jgi:phospholipid/cholesterol/gamma-HCH transport system substrate-binding protein
MASKKTKFTVGLFVASGIAIILIAIIWLGMSRFMEKGQYYVSYFNESVQGLRKDSPVKYRGVSIGRVTQIGVAPDSKLIQVVLKIESGQELSRDIVAQLKDVGITGSKLVELDLKKKGESDRSPRISFPSEYPVVASKPSEISELLKGLDDVLKDIGSMDLKGISDKMKLVLDSANQMIADADVKTISKSAVSSLDGIDNILDKKRWDRILVSIGEAGRSLNTLMQRAEKAVDRMESTVSETGRSLNGLIHKTEKSVDRMENTLVVVEGIVGENRQPIKSAIEELESSMKNANIFMEKATSLAGRADDISIYLKRYLLIVAQNLEKTSQNLNRLIELVADQPSQLIFGGAPVPRKVAPEAHGE